MAIGVVVLVTWGSAQGGIIPGGGKSASDCYVEFDVPGASGSNKVGCVDGDPACDADGQCQGVCTFAVGVCLNQANVAGCTPSILDKPLEVKGATLAVPATQDTAPVCGERTQVPVALKGKKRTKRGRKRIKAIAVVDGAPSRDSDRLVLLCSPRRGECPAPPTTTTTTTIGTSTTTTTLAADPDAQLLLVGSRIAAFSTVDPSLVDEPVTLIGMIVGDSLVSIDRRSRNGFLYALGFNAGAGSVQLYAVHAATAFAVPIGATGTFVDSGGAPVVIGDGVATRFGMDFNPAVDRLRVVVSTGQSFRMNPNTGALIDGDLGGSLGSVPGLNMDGPIHGTTDTVQETAYTNVDPLATITTMYTLDASLDTLCIQNPPNLGIQTACKALGMAIDAVLGFDIAPGVNAPASNAAASGQGLAVVRPAGQPTEVLASVDLTTGVLGATMPVGTSDVLGMALQKPASVPMVGLPAPGTSLVRFTPAALGTTSTVPITGVVAGETIVSIDFRPQTGQLFGLGVNATANNGTLYLVDPQTGAVTVVGVASQIAFVDGGGSPVDFPNPAVDGWGIDFNPAVDRLRVVAGTGLNFRVNPNTGAPIDGNLGTAIVTSGTNTDGPINGATTSVHETAYTNNFGGDLTGGHSITVYTLDAATDSLYIQNPPNSGTQTNPVPVTVGGFPLDFGARCGFDIPSDVRVGTSNLPVTQGSAWAGLTVAGGTRLYRIDLPTGVATDFGAIGDGSTGFVGLAVGQTTLE